MTDYYLVVEEWNYPTESGREPCELTFDKKEEALAWCQSLAEKERATFDENVKMDALEPGKCDDGWLITTKMGLDPFYYYAYVIPRTPLSSGAIHITQCLRTPQHDHQTH